MVGRFRTTCLVYINSWQIFASSNTTIEYQKSIPSLSRSHHSFAKYWPFFPLLNFWELVWIDSFLLVPQIASLAYNASSTLIRFLYVQSSLKKDVHYVYKRQILYNQYKRETNRKVEGRMERWTRNKREGMRKKQDEKS